MTNKTWVRFVHSLVLLPFLTSMPLGNIKDSNLINDKPLTLSIQQLNNDSSALFSFNQEDKEEEKRELILSKKAEIIDNYYKTRNMPLYGYGRKMVEEAEKNDLDWRLIPAISVIETTGGRNLCKSLPRDLKYNPFGWGSCKIGFKSFDEAIEKIALNLGGNNPKTAHHYDGKTTLEIINKYNPPSIVPDYSKKIFKVMNTLGDEIVIIEDTQKTNS